MTNEEGHGTDDTNPKHRGEGGGGLRGGILHSVRYICLVF
jgi:hypothetical protein